MRYELDATNQAMGRLASKTAVLLRGKEQAGFKPNALSGNTVKIRNISKMQFSGKKLEQKKYHHYSGYPGGLKTKTLKNAWAENPQRVFRQCVYGMLPKNRSRAKMIKNLLFN